ncbi:MAG: nuclear transport factor 2 family protein [Acidimicrobiales bacterium]
MPSPEELRGLLAAYVDAVNSRDAAAIADRFSEDARQSDPVSNPPTFGRPAIRAFFENGIVASESWTFAVKATHTCASNIAIDFEITVVTEGGTMTIDGIEIFDVGDDGLFTAVNAYWDESDLRFE